jgi:hypothetical protein
MIEEEGKEGAAAAAEDEEEGKDSEGVCSGVCFSSILSFFARLRPRVFVSSFACSVGCVLSLAAAGDDEDDEEEEEAVDNKTISRMEMEVRLERRDLVFLSSAGMDGDERSG